MRPELQDLPEPQWFHHGERILALLDEHRPRLCVELGTYRGGSAIAVGRVVQQWEGKVFCFDLWDGEVPVRECAANIRAAGVASTVWLERMMTEEGARWWSESMRQIDYLYVDADHTAAGCLSDLELWWPLLRTGGVIAGDDYDDPHGDPSSGVTAAWDAFEKAHGQAFEREVSVNLLGCRCPNCLTARLIWGIKR